MAYNTNVILENSADGYVAEGKSIKGGYFVIDALANIPSVLNVKGAKCYNQADDKVYIYNGSSWIVDTSAGMSNPMTTAGDIIVGGASGAPTRLAKGTDGQVVKMVNGAPAWANESGGTTLYKHSIKPSGYNDVMLVIINTSSTPITSLTFFIGDYLSIRVSGNEKALSAKLDSNNYTIIYYYINSSNGQIVSVAYPIENCVDTVTTL